MSRFSPGGLLGHHGLSPAGGGHHHLPHMKHEDGRPVASVGGRGNGGSRHVEKESKHHCANFFNAIILHVHALITLHFGMRFARLSSLPEI
jgi:hypothetical protein